MGELTSFDTTESFTSNEQLRMALADLIEDAPRQYEQLLLARKWVEQFCDQAPLGYDSQLVAHDPIILRTNGFIQMLAGSVSVTGHHPDGGPIDFKMIEFQAYNPDENEWLCLLQRQDNESFCTGKVDGTKLVQDLRQDVTS